MLKWWDNMRQEQVVRHILIPKLASDTASGKVCARAHTHTQNVPGV